MSDNKNTNNHTTRYESLCDLNLLNLWSLSGSDWTSIVKEEIQAATNQPTEEEESNFTNKVLSLGVLASLALLATAAWIRAPKISQAVQEVGKNSVEELLLKNY